MSYYLKPLIQFQPRPDLVYQAIRLFTQETNVHLNIKETIECLKDWAGQLFEERRLNPTSWRYFNLEKTIIYEIKEWLAARKVESIVYTLPNIHPAHPSSWIKSNSTFPFLNRRRLLNPNIRLLQI